MATMPVSDRERVRAVTDPEINRRIDAATAERVRHFRAHPDDIPARLAELDREWDIERAVQANAASLSLAGLALGAFVDRRFLALPALVAGFLLQHAIQGWCPPVPVLRRLGFRTMQEIDRERIELRGLRGGMGGRTGAERHPPAAMELENLPIG